MFSTYFTHLTCFCLAIFVPSKILTYYWLCHLVEIWQCYLIYDTWWSDRWLSRYCKSCQKKVQSSYNVHQNNSNESLLCLQSSNCVYFCYFWFYGNSKRCLVSFADNCIPYQVSLKAVKVDVFFWAHLIYSSVSASSH